MLFPLKMLILSVNLRLNKIKLSEFKLPENFRSSALLSRIFVYFKIKFWLFYFLRFCGIF